MALPLKKDCFVSSITVLSLKTLGLDSLEWDPRVLRDSLEMVFDTQRIPQRVFDKLNCGYMLVGTDAYTSTIEGFLTGNAIMSNKVFDASELPYNTFKDIAWGVWEYINLLGDIQDGKPTDEFSSDIKVYIQQAAEVEGIRKYPEWLKFAEPSIAILPDVGVDNTSMEMYLSRQQDNINKINTYVKDRQEKLTEELLRLQKNGSIASSTVTTEN